MSKHNMASIKVKRRRKWLKAYYGEMCFYCEKAPGDTLEHLIPRSAGGENALTNLVLACNKCNNTRGNGELPYIPEANREKLEWYKGMDEASRARFHETFARAVNIG